MLSFKKFLFEALMDEYIEDLKPEDQKFWIEFAKQDEESCLEILKFLDASKWEDPYGNRPPAPPSEKSLQSIKEFAGTTTYSKLYKGVEQAEDYGYGDEKTFIFNNVSFWTQDKEWAEVFIEDIPEGKIIEMDYNPAYVVLDMNIVPFILAPDGGREEEILIRPGKYKCKVVS